MVAHGRAGLAGVVDRGEPREAPYAGSVAVRRGKGAQTTGRRVLLALTAAGWFCLAIAPARHAPPVRGGGVLGAEVVDPSRIRQG